MIINAMKYSHLKFLLRVLTGTIFISLVLFINAGNTQDLILENMTISSTVTYTASNSITAGTNFTIASTGEVTLKSGNFITFKPSFVVIGGGKLYALTGVSTGLVAKEDAALPTHFSLQQNYPNPFNPTTNIEFSLPEAAEVELKVLNILGEEVATLVSDRLSAGSYTYQWSRPAGMASGVYLYRLSVESLTTKSGHYVTGGANEFVETRKMVLMR